MTHRQGQNLALRPLTMLQFRYAINERDEAIWRNNPADVARHDVARRLSRKRIAKHAVDVALSHARAEIENHGRQPLSAYRDAACKKLRETVARVSCHEAWLPQSGPSLTT